MANDKQVQGRTEGAQHASPETRGAQLECSLIMKGGITSGVVYPGAVTILAKRYRFRRIGGSSAGAIAALLTSAAEYRRNATGSEAGFELLEQVPQTLAEGNNLVRLFSPSAACATAFKVVLALVSANSKSGKWRPLLRALGIVLRAWWLVAAAVAVLALLPGLWLGIVLVQDGHPVWAAFLLMLWLLGVAVLTLGVTLYLATKRALQDMTKNGFGLAKGSTDSGAGKRTVPWVGIATGASALPPTGPLTDWLSEVTQLVAGRPNDKPLTFGDLWGEEATSWYLGIARQQGDETPQVSDLDRAVVVLGPQEAPDSGQPARATAIFDPMVDLLVMTTCLTQAIPYTFPFADDAMHYCRKCFAEYFPPSVMAHFEATDRPSGEHKDGARILSNECPRHPGHDLNKLPLVPDIPVVVAARLSLSFPGLISAVPLYYLDFGKKDPSKRGFVTAWFSDGGIASNFPMHFFDTHLPSRPTFGINLEDANPVYGDSGAVMRQANTPVTPRERPIETMTGFVGSIVGTMQGWQDALQSYAPGYRDRIVTAYVPEGAGGMNLVMTPEQVQALGDLGEKAGAEILDQFDLKAHQWARFRVAMNGLSVLLEQHRRNYPRFDEQVTYPWSGSYQLGLRDEKLVRKQATDLVELANQWQATGYPATRSSPRPEPMLRFVARTGAGEPTKPGGGQ